MSLNTQQEADGTPVADASPADPQASSLQSSRKRRGGIVIERPAPENGSWERWHFAGGADSKVSSEPLFLGESDALPPHSRRVIALPSRRLFAWPLWIAGEGEATDLVRMELSGRHMLKRGMEDSLAVIPVLREGERRLVLAVAPEEPFPSEGLPANWTKGTSFEPPARLLAGAPLSDLIIWQEWNTLQMALYREGKPVWFCGVRQEEMTGVLRRTALRLLAEGVLDRMPSAIRIQGMPEDLANRCAGDLRASFPLAKIVTLPSESGSLPLPPELPAELATIIPTLVREERLREAAGRRILLFAAGGIFLYLMLLLWGAGDLILRQRELSTLRREISKLEKPALQAKSDSAQWQALRQAVDPSAYALDLMAALAAPTEGGKVRLTRFSLEHGRIQISGEATDVTQAYAFIEQLKKSPQLHEYEWNAGQPQLAGKNSVKFDMEGTRSDATTGH